MTDPTSSQHPAPHPEASTLGQLRASGHRLRTLREELRDNLLARLRSGEDPWPGLHGFSETVVPQVVRTRIASTVPAESTE